MRICAALFVLLLPFGPAWGGERKPKDYTRNAGGGLNFFSEKDDFAIGQRYSNELNSRLKLISEPRVLPYIDALGRRLIASSRKPGMTARFFVVNTREVNAFALPGGFIYINRGLIDLAETEEQLAGVVAHELSHVTARHGTRQMSKQLLLMGIVGGASALAGARSEKWGGIIATAGGVGMLFATMKYSRNDEYQADALAAETLARAGYSPQGLVEFFERMDPTRAGRLDRALALLNTHPPAADRIRNLRAQIAVMKSPAGGPIDREPFAWCKHALNAMPPPPAKDVTLSNALAAVGLAEGSRMANQETLAPLGVREQAQHVFDVPGNTVWLDTGIPLRKGQHFEIWADGEVQIRRDTDLACDANGVFGTGKGFFKPISSVNTGALLGRIDAGNQSGKPFPIGAHSVLAAPEAGTLRLGINDDNNFDNRGAFRVWVLTR